VALPRHPMLLPRADYVVRAPRASGEAPARARSPAHSHPLAGGGVPAPGDAAPRPGGGVCVNFHGYEGFFSGYSGYTRTSGPLAPLLALQGLHGSKRALRCGVQTAVNLAGFGAFCVWIPPGVLFRIHPR
jgi:hypothetical protein